MKENEIPSAEEFLLDQGIPEEYLKNLPWFDEGNLMTWLVEFAKLHVKAALEAAAEKAHTDTFSKNRNNRWIKMTGEFEFDPTNFEHKYVVNKKSILSAYPEELIK